MKKGILLVVVFLFTLFNFFVMQGCGSSGSSSKSRDDGPIEYDHNTMLEALGVDTDIGARENPVGEVVAEDYNPTLKPANAALGNS